MKPHTWLLLGNYGGNNTGDDAMLWALIRALREAHHCRFLVLARSELPAAVKLLGAIQVKPSLYSVLRAVGQSDGLILGGGTHFHDDYPPRRYYRHLWYMTRFVLLFALGRLRGQPVVMASMGFGPIRRRSADIVARLACALASCITVRDRASHQMACHWLGENTKVTEVFDVAVLAAGPQTAPSLGPVRNLGVCLISTDCLRHVPTDQLTDIEFKLTELFAALLGDRPELRVTFLVFRGDWPRESDAPISRLIADRLVLQFGGRVTLVEYTPEPDKLLTKMQECDAIVATRYHSAVLAFAVNRPMLFLMYHQKCAEVARMMELPATAQMPASEFTMVLMASRLRQLVDRPQAFQPGLDLNLAQRQARRSIERTIATVAR